MSSFRAASYIILSRLGDEGCASVQVPWVDGFPFNVVSHPQYVGSVLSIWGLAVAVGQQRPEGTLLVAAYWTGLYVVTAMQESLF